MDPEGREELFDWIALKKIVDNWDDLKGPFKNDFKINGKIYKPKKILDDYLATAKRLENGMGIRKVQYKYSAFHKEDQQGRLFVRGSRGLQCFKRIIRNTLTKDLYREYDIANCHPSLLVQYCDKQKIDCECLKDYVNNREKRLVDIMKTDNKTREQAKKAILEMLNGGKCYLKNTWARKFHNAMFNVLDDVANKEDNKALYEKIKTIPPEPGKDDNFEGRTTNHRLCIIENDILMSIMSCLKSNDKSTANIILEFDGFELPKSVFDPDEEELKQFFANMQQHIYAETDYKVILTEKIKESFIDLSKYEFKEFKLTHIDPSIFKTMIKTIEKEKKNDIIPVEVFDKTLVVDYLNQYLRIITGTSTPQYLEISDLHPSGFIIRKIYGTDAIRANWAGGLALQGETPFTIWLTSENRAEIESFVFIPYLKEPPQISDDVYNTFKGFKHKYDPNFEIDMEKVQPFLNLIKEVWANNDPILYDYTIKWFARKVQLPGKKIGVSIVAMSTLQGTGKNTVFEYITTHVLGKQYGVQIQGVDALFDRFNSQFEQTLIVCGDEIASGGSMWKNSEKIKSLVTRPFQNIENKGFDVRKNCPDYNDFLIATNNSKYAIKVDPADRRFFCLELSNIRAGDYAYWNEFYSKYMNDDCGQHVFHYLANLDLSTFDPKNIPMTEWKRELRNCNINPVFSSILLLIKSRYDRLSKKWTLTETFFQTAEFFNFYDRTSNPKVTEASYGKELKGVLGLNSSTAQKTLYGKPVRRRGYHVTIEELKRIAIKRLNDDTFDFITYGDVMEYDDGTETETETKQVTEQVTENS